MYEGSVDTFSNREDWEFPIYQIEDDETGDLIDLTNADIVFSVADPDGCVVLTGSTTSGDVTLPDSTSFLIFVDRDRVTGLCTGTYAVGVTIENAGQTIQFIIGSVTVLKGIVPA